MTIEEIAEQLNQTSAALANLAPDDPQRFDLEIMRSQLKKEIIVGSFDITKDISAITVADVSKLRELTAQLRDATIQEQQRAELVGKIVSIAKLALRSTGIPV